MKRKPYLVIFCLGLVLSVQNLLPTLETKNINGGTNNGLISKPNPSGIIIEDSSEFSEGTMENLNISNNGYLMLDTEFPAQPNWTNMAPSTKPSARWCHSMVYDSTHDKVILFGGWDGDYDDETWAYDLNTNTWTNMNPSTKPSARYVHSMVYDSTHDKVILFGGEEGGLDDETWAYDLNTNTWTNMNPSTKPLARGWHSMAYDSTHDKVILFGGIDGGVDDETWAYDLDTNAWTNMNPSTKPSVRSRHSMAYDSTHDKIILFGGSTGGDETWAYDLATNTWTNMNPPTKPSARRRHSMAYDSTHDKIILFGGYDGGVDDETWAYDLDINKWTNMNPPTKPSERYGHSIAYDSTHDKVILFGGNDAGGFDNETWVFRFWNYQQTGKLDSKIISLDNNHKFFGEISWSPENQPVGTNLTVQIGFSDIKNDENFTYTSPENTSFTFEGVAHYFRYRVNFESTNDLAFSPMLENVMIDYIVEIKYNNYSNVQNIITIDESESKGDTIIREENSLAMVMLVGLIGVISVFVIFAILSRRRFKTLEGQVKLAGKGLKSKSIDK